MHGSAAENYVWGGPDSSPGRFEEVDVTGGNYEPATPFSAIWVNGAGDVAVEDRDGNSEVFTFPASSWVEFRGWKILQTGTTATGIRVGRP